MKTTSYRGTDKLTPDFRSKVDKFIAEVNKNGPIIFITETWRSIERQSELLRAGLSQVKHSNHQDGLAVDIAFYGSELYPSDMKKWRQIAEIAKKHGIEWGYDLWSWDKPHFQNNTNFLPSIEKPVKKTKYSDIMTQALKDANMEPLFSSHEGDTTLTEGETKELIEIAFARFKKSV